MNMDFACFYIPVLSLIALCLSCWRIQLIGNVRYQIVAVNTDTRQKAAWNFVLNLDFLVVFFVLL